MLFLVISRAQNWPLILGHCLQWALLCTISIWKSYFISPFQKRKSCQLSALTGVGQLFLKGLHSKYFRLFGQLCQGGHLSSHRGYVNEWVWLCSKYNFIHKNRQLFVGLSSPLSTLKQETHWRKDYQDHSRQFQEHTERSLLKQSRREFCHCPCWTLSVFISQSPIHAWELMFLQGRELACRPLPWLVG